MRSNRRDLLRQRVVDLGIYVFGNPSNLRIYKIADKYASVTSRRP